jgi:hypothetical protein
MPCRLERPSPQDLFDSIKEKFEANVLGGYKVVPESNEWYVVANDYAAHEMFYSMSESAFKSMDPREACCADLYDMAELDGFVPKGATFSQGYARISGAPGTVIPSPIEISFSGVRFIVVGCDSGIIGPDGYAVVRLRAVTPGSEANSAVRDSQIGTVSNTSTGLDEEAEAFGNNFCGGAEEETCEQFRARYLAGMAYKPKATYAWIINKILEWPCVTRVAHRNGSCCTVPEGPNPGCTCNSCTNKLEFYPLFDGTFDCGIPPACVIQEMNTWLFGSPQGRGLGQVEIGVCGMLYEAQPALVNLRLGGLTCATVNQINQIKERVTDLFGRAVPSEILRAKSFEILVAQLMGDLGNYTATFEVVSGEMGLSPCGDLVPPCDVLPCLNEIIVVNAFAGQTACG